MKLRVPNAPMIMFAENKINPALFDDPIFVIGAPSSLKK
jgi:hypothetical protein